MWLKNSRRKDRIAKHILASKNKGDTSIEIAKRLNIPHYSVYTLITEMSVAGHIAVIQTGSVEHYHSYYAQIIPAGEHFLDNTSYSMEAIKEWWREAPKNFWVIGALIGLITTNAALISKLISKEQSATKQETPIQSGSAKPDTLIQR